MTERAKDLYDRISLLDLTLGDRLDDIAVTAIGPGDIADLEAAAADLERALASIERVRARYANWLPAKED